MTDGGGRLSTPRRPSGEQRDRSDVGEVDVVERRLESTDEPDTVIVSVVEGANLRISGAEGSAEQCRRRHIAPENGRPEQCAVVGENGREMPEGSGLGLRSIKVTRSSGAVVWARYQPLPGPTSRWRRPTCWWYRSSITVASHRHANLLLSRITQAS
ncbi:hypothetical protein [Nocardia sp. NPDC050413]|uniref:hypothetical protein n=1 Tax=Nocardia sp. NPDC050413 TaxID=3155784 RepID=UPI00340C307E